MKISDIFGSNIDTITNQKKVEKNVQSQNANIEGVKKVAQDSVDISQTARLLSRLEDYESDHQKRLEAVQKAYENGTYKPDLANLAKSLLEEIKNG